MVSMLKSKGVDPSKPEVFARQSYLALLEPKYKKVMIIQHRLMSYLRERLASYGFIELLPPMISTASDPGLRGASKLTTELYGYRYELTCSTIMFKQIAASSLTKIFFMARNVREEPPENLYTGRHLAEFTQLDVEWGEAYMEDVMRLVEDIVYYAWIKTIEESYNILKEFRKEFPSMRPPFRKITYDEALSLAKELGYKVTDGKELSQEAEEALSREFKEPFWIINFPTSSRGFYYLETFDGSGKNRDFNLILPEGFGELVDGGEREYRYGQIKERIKALGEDLSKYEWFMEALKDGIVKPSAGFGLGIERFTRFVLGLKYIWEAVPFPKPPGIAPTP